MKTHIQDNTPMLTTNTGELFHIPEGGSLGLLALGYVGIMLWRNKRQEIQKKHPKNA